MSAMNELWDRMWEEFRESERDPVAYAEKMRVCKLRDEQNWSRRRIGDLRESLDWEKILLRVSELTHGVLK